MWQALLVLKFKEIIKLSQTRVNYTKTIVNIYELVWLTLSAFGDMLISEREQEGNDDLHGYI